MGGLTDVIEHEIIPFVAKTAPLLASGLGSPLSGMVLSLIAQTFGVNPSDIAGINSALTSSPDAAYKLKALEDQHAEALARIASTDYMTEVDDRKNARAQSAPYPDFMRHMAYIVTLGFFGALVCMFFPIQIDPNERELLSMLVGMLVSKWQTIIDFFYGSSHKQGGLK